MRRIERTATGGECRLCTCIFFHFPGRVRSALPSMRFGAAFSNQNGNNFGTESNRRVCTLNEHFAAKSRYESGQAADFSELKRRTDITVLFHPRIPPFARDRTSSAPSVFPISTTCWETDLLVARDVSLPAGAAVESINFDSRLQNFRNLM